MFTHCLGGRVRYQLFYYEDSCLLPEARWFLWQWERYKGLHEPIALPVRALLAEFKMPYREGQATLLWLKSKGYIEATSGAVLNTKSRGRPSYTYRVAPWLLTALESLPSEVPSSSDVIEHISQCAELTNSVASKAASLDEAEAAVVTASPNGSESNEESSADTESSSQELSKELADKDADKDKKHVSVRYPNLYQSHLRKEKLTLANRWLMMVLLARSKTLGVVTDLSLTTLQGLTGMSKNSLVGQLKKAKVMGLIAYHQPGQPGTLLGVSMTSIYQLNLKHPLFGKPEREAVAIYLLPEQVSKHHTDLFHGVIDALLAYGVCLAHEKRLIAAHEESSPNTANNNPSEQSGNATNVSSNAYQLILALDEKLRANERVRLDAGELLPSMRQLTSVVNALVNNCDASKARWLRAHVHTEAIHLLTTQWLASGNKDILPDAPSAEETPEESLRQRLILHMAKNLYQQLTNAAIQCFEVEHANKEDLAEFSGLDYMLTPALDRNGKVQSLWVLRGYSSRIDDMEKLKPVISTSPSVQVNLRDYWQAYHSKGSPV